ncbi:MAG: hypothetical protein LLG04_18215 [Parachlamydia sp.]|nr:hypothetical protein [Parachlamydia sp.]
MKNMGAILLVAGTCIGSGMIALPLVLAQMGLLPSLLLMLGIWYLMYYTSLINLELNLQAGEGLPLGELGRKFACCSAEWSGILILKLLSYALLAVFLYGGSSVAKEWLESRWAIEASLEYVATGFALAAALILLCPLAWIDYLNRVLFTGLLGVVIVLIVCLLLSIEWTNLPWLGVQCHDWKAWLAVLPVVFTSFGFQVIFHTLTNYCHKDAKRLKQAFFWGSAIPAIVYIAWTCSVMSVVHHENPGFYGEMVQGTAAVGELIQVLSGIANWETVQLLVWAISLLAIVTSILGVGVGLLESLKGMLRRSIHAEGMRSSVSSVATIGPAYLAVIAIPNAFIAVLGFAGMILAIIAILLPTYLSTSLARPFALSQRDLCYDGAC